MVLKQNGMPNAAAALAPSISPSAWNRPASPVGPIASGMEIGLPSTVVASETAETSTMTRCRNVSASRSAAFARRVRSSYDPPSA